MVNARRKKTARTAEYALGIGKKKKKKKINKRKCIKNTQQFFFFYNLSYLYI